MTNTRLKAWLTRSGGLSAELAAVRGGLSMRQLATRLGGGWNSSKVSKIENGDQLISADDLAAWVTAAGADEGTHRHLRELLDEALAKRATFRRRRPPTVSAAEQLPDALEASAGHIRVVGPYALPDLLQTKEYAEALRPGLPPEKFRQEWEQIQARQARLTDPLTTFDFLIPEASLRMVPEKVQVMSGQLDRLISASSMGNVNVRVVPLLAPLPTFPLPGAVTICDDEALVRDGVEQRHYTGAAAKLVTDWLDILWAAALKGEDARARIIAAVDALRDI